MKITKFKRALSVLLVAVMIISTLPLNAMGLDEMERSTRPADSTNNIFEDLFWELIKPFIKPKVTVKGLKVKYLSSGNTEQDLTLVYNGYTLIEGTDYTLAYADNDKVGTASITIAGIGDFTGERVLKYKVKA